ncbi:MAG: acyl carrier protein [Clostridium sp.]|nr:acyl carrier protein [Clostridium sp.]
MHILEQNGVFLSDNYDEPLIMDSLTFVTMVVDIEQTFGIAYPDELLSYNPDMSLFDLEKIVLTILQPMES